MVGVVAVLLHLFSAFIFGVLPLLAFPPEEDTTKYQQRYYNDRNHNSDGCLSTRAQSARTGVLCILKASRVGAGRVARP